MSLFSSLLKSQLRDAQCVCSHLGLVLRVPVATITWECGNRYERYRVVPVPRNIRIPQFKWDWKDFERKLAEHGGYTVKPMRIDRLGGRDPYTGRRVNQHCGGGYKFDYFAVDMRRYGPTDGSFYEERVLELRQDFNRTAFIMLTAGTRGKRWLIATHTIKPGDIIRTSSHIPLMPVSPKVGDAYALGALPTGTQIHCVEANPGLGTKLCIQAGTSATIIRRQEGGVVIRLPNKHEVCLKENCMAVVGQVSNIGHHKEHLGCPNVARQMGIMPSSGKWHRRDGHQGRKIKPLPKLRTFDSPDPLPPGTYKLTLSKLDCAAEFGAAAAKPILLLG